MCTDRMMPRYKSHKIVHALHIAALEVHKDGSATIAPRDKGFAPFRTPPNWAERFKGSEEDPGVFVAYEDGYTSWSPTQAFTEGYLPISGVTGMDFGGALRALQDGEKVARAGWNGKGMYLILVPGTQGVRPVAGTPYSKAGITEPTNIDPHIDMFTAQGSMQPGWLASQADMLADDWVIVD